MPQNKKSQGIIFLATILSKMSQMFSEINSVYLQVMMHKSSVELAPQYNVSDLFHSFQREKQDKSLGLSELDDFLSSEEEAEEEPKSKKYEETNKSNLCKQVQSQNKQDHGKQCSVSPPRPPPSSYLLFFNDHRQKIAEEFPNLNVSQLSKIASKCWKQLSSEEKKPYHDRFNEEKHKYYEALKSYNLFKNENSGQSKEKGKQRRKQKKQPNQKRKKQEKKVEEVNSELSSSTL